MTSSMTSLARRAHNGAAESTDCELRDAIPTSKLVPPQVQLCLPRPLRAAGAHIITMKLAGVHLLSVAAP